MSQVTGIGGVTPLNIQGMDLETAMMAVQSNRANLLEAQLKDQIASVQAKNDQIAKLNQLLGVLNKASASCFDGNAKADTRIDASGTFKNSSYAMEREVNDAFLSAGIKPDLSTDTSGGGGLTTQLDASGKEVRLPGGIRGDVTKGKLDGAIQQLKSQIDSASNSQQMDMLRLQSLSNKRNEAFELMTNFIKKMQDNRSSIVGNMR